MQTMCRAILQEGHQLTVLTLSEKGALHEALEQMGVETHSVTFPRKPSWRYYLRHKKFLVRFCNEMKIQVIWSHFSDANLIALLAGRKLKIKVVPFRHHDESAFYALYGRKFGMKRSRKERILDFIVNRMANPLVVLSDNVRNNLILYEKMKPNRVKTCFLFYDFSLYATPDSEIIRHLQDQMPFSLRMIIVSRMMESKQHLAAFRVVKKLRDEGLSVGLVVMDGGPMKSALEYFIAKHQLEKEIFMAGFSTNVQDYMAAADLLIHPSVTEASNNVVKEMAMLQKPVLVCKGVGDFDAYICDGKNGFMINRDHLEDEMEQVIRYALANKQKLPELGAALKNDVYRIFSDTSANRQMLLSLFTN